MLTPSEELESRMIDEWPPCLNCGHAGEDHEDGNCRECMCVDYEPLDAEDVLDREGKI